MLVLAASVVVADREASLWWVGPALVALVLWPLSRGWRVAWWAMLIAVGGNLVVLAGLWRDVSEPESGLSVFVGKTRVLSVGVMLGVALALLLLARVRRFCTDDPRERTALGSGVAALVIGAFPGLALNFDPRLPSTRMLEDTANAVFVGGDSTHPVAFYVVEDEGRQVCLVALEPRSGNRSCAERRDLDSPGMLRSDDLFANLVSKDVVRVEVVDSQGGFTNAEVLDDPRAPANVFYLPDPPPIREPLEMTGYDARGRVVFYCDWDDWGC